MGPGAPRVRHWRAGRLGGSCLHVSLVKCPRRLTKLQASAVSPCATCTFAPQMDFSKRLYYVHVRLTRFTASPRVSTLRIF